MVGLITALKQLHRPEQPVQREELRLDDTPVTILQHPEQQPHDHPAVVIAHGFAASRNIMSAFALTLARAGYTALTFDFAGHGQNTTPLSGDMADFEGRYQQLKSSLQRVVDLARTRGNGQVALIGHSMGSAVVTRYGQEHPEIAAVIGVSLVYDQVTPETPRNLLVINGEREMQLRPMAQQVIDQVAGGSGSGSIGSTYGNLADGTGRRVVYANGAEHLGILFHHTSMREALSWLNACFRRPDEPDPYIDQRLPWFGLLYASALLLFWPCAELLRLARGQHPPLAPVSPLPFRWWLGITLLPALITPLLLRLIPARLTNRFLPIIIGGPLTLHFAFYGGLTAAGLWLAQRALPDKVIPTYHTPQLLFQAVAAALLMSGYAFLTMGQATQRSFVSYFPSAQRLPVAAAVFAAMLPYFLADEYLTRRPGAPRGAYALTKMSFVGSLALAIALNPRQLFFLILVAPMLLAYFAIYGFLGALLYHRSQMPLSGAIANALICACGIAANFPLVQHSPQRRA